MMEEKNVSGLEGAGVSEEKTKIEVTEDVLNLQAAISNLKTIDSRNLNNFFNSLNMVEKMTIAKAGISLGIFELQRKIVNSEINMRLKKEIQIQLKKNSISLKDNYNAIRKVLRQMSQEKQQLMEKYFNANNTREKSKIMKQIKELNENINILREIEREFRINITQLTADKQLLKKQIISDYNSLKNRLAKTIEKLAQYKAMNELTSIETKVTIDLIKKRLKEIQQKINNNEEVDVDMIRAELNNYMQNINDDNIKQLIDEIINTIEQKEDSKLDEKTVNELLENNLMQNMAEQLLNQ